MNQSELTDFETGEKILEWHYIVIQNHENEEIFAIFFSFNTPSFSNFFNILNAPFGAILHILASSLIE